MSYLLVFLVFLVGDADERPRHPLAPSIPLLSKEEEKGIEDIVDRFILFDIGKLKGAAGKKALEDFNRLGPEAIFQLIDGFNRGANMESSCPCVIIGKKIALILNASEDVHLLAFAKENIGTGVMARRHMAVVADLKFAAQLRRSAVVRRVGITPYPSTRGPLVKKSVDELAELIQAKGAQSKPALEELGRRTDPKVLDILAAAGDPLARAALQKWVAKRPAKEIAPLLSHESAPVRQAAALQAGKQKALAPALIELLQDADPAVIQAARASLKQISGLDHGPLPSATLQDRGESYARWRAWLGARK